MSEMCLRCVSMTAECGYAPCGAIRPEAHEAALAAARQVDEASERIVRHIAGMVFPESGHPYGSIPRQLVYDARAALNSEEAPDGSA